MCDHKCHGGCDHGASSQDLGLSFSLYKFINLSNVECLNESISDSGKLVFKPFESRNDSSTFVESDSGEELLFTIPFTGNVKLKEIIISGDVYEQHPRNVALYKNKPFMTLSNLSSEPDQSLEIAFNPSGDLIYPLKITKFSSVDHLSIYISSNNGTETTKLHYIGLRGDFTPVSRQKIVIANYEIAPNIADHKLKTMDMQSHFIK